MDLSQELKRLQHERLIQMVRRINGDKEGSRRVLEIEDQISEIESQIGV